MQEAPASGGTGLVEWDDIVSLSYPRATHDPKETVPRCPSVGCHPPKSRGCGKSKDGPRRFTGAGNKLQSKHEKGSHRRYGCHTRRRLGSRAKAGLVLST